MTTFQMVTTVIGLLLSFLTLIGLGTLAQNFLADRREKARASKAEAIEEAARKRKAEIREVLVEELLVVKEDLGSQIASLDTDIGHIKEGIANLQKAVDRLQVSLVRVDRILMKANLDSYKEQGYASESDRAAWNELYQDYKELGGNHFKEYVNEWRSTLEALPKAKAEQQ